jgi:hypothetical protein
VRRRSVTIGRRMTAPTAIRRDTILNDPGSSSSEAVRELPGPEFIAASAGRELDTHRGVGLKIGDSIVRRMFPSGDVRHSEV